MNKEEYINKAVEDTYNKIKSKHIFKMLDVEDPGFVKDTIREALQEAFEKGEDSGYELGEEEGYSRGYDAGYDEGYDTASAR